MNFLLNYLNRPFAARNIKRQLFIITAIAFLIRLFAWYSEPAIERDGVIYMQLATNWLQTGHYPPHAYLPLLPFMIKTGMQLGISGYFAGTIFNIVLGSCLPVIIFYIVKICSGKNEISIIAALLMAFNPSMAELSSQIIRDMPYLFFAGLTILFSLCAIKKNCNIFWILSGFSLSLGIICRYEILELGIIILGYFSWLLILKKKTQQEIVRHLVFWLVSVMIFSILMFTVMGLGGRMKDDYQARIIRIFNAGN